MPIRRVLLVLCLAVVCTGCVNPAAPFEDDFSDPASGWGAASHETFVRGYQQGRYLIQIDVPQWFVWTTAGRRYTDVTVTGKVQAEGALDNHYGLLCRYTEGNFYYFAISADGYYAIFRRINGGPLEPMTGRAMLRSPLIHTDGSANQVMAVCEGQLLSLFVNGELIAQAQDNLLDRGDVGMAAGTLKKGGTVVWFDDLAAVRPGGE
jgi:hypothetical protein